MPALMRPAWLALACVLTPLVAPRLASAQPAPAHAAAPSGPGARILVSPRPITPLHADYPAGARGDAQVLLIVTVNADGSVRSAAIAEGAEPFAAAAIAASKGWRFDPATRDGAPIAATIRAAIAFTAPAPIVAPEAALPAQIAPGVAKPPPPPPAPIEVTVLGEQTPPGATTMSRAEVRLLPGAFGDPFRAVEMLPGVTPIASGVPFFYVRGAPPGNVGYFLDGIRVPLLYHLGLGPSVVHPAIMDRVDLYPGGYPARFGRFAGGIVAGETRGPGDAFHGEANLRVVDAGAFVESPFADGRGQALVSGRYSYTAALLSLVQSAIDLRYWDYQARVGFDLTPRDRVEVFAFGAYDFLAQKQDDGTEQLLFDTTFHRLDFRYDHRFGKDTKVRQAVTLGWDKTRLPGNSYARDRMLAARTEAEVRVTEDAVVRAGLDVVADAIDFDLARVSDGASFPNAFVPRVDLAMGARADVVWQVSPRLEVTPGLRVDFYGSHNQPSPGGDPRLASRFTAVGVDPRLAARVTARPWLHVLSAIGLASQPPSFILPGPGFTIGIADGLQKSAQASLGVEVDLPEDVQAKITLFHSAFFALTDALGTAPPSSSDFSQSFTRRTLGSGTGLEITVRRRLTRKLGGFLSYTLSRSNRAIVGSTPTGIAPQTVDVFAVRLPSTFDRTHVLNLALGYDVGRGYKAGARVVFYTGTPRTIQGPEPGFVPVDLHVRLPPFFRLDARLEKRWTVGQRGWLALVLEVQNATLSKEVVGRDCTSGPCTDTTIGPVTIPSLGLEGGI
jgi:TonB family protein